MILAIIVTSVFWLLAFIVFLKIYEPFPKTADELDTIKWFRKKLARDFKNGAAHFSHLAHAEKMTAEQILRALGEEMELETDYIFKLPYREAFLNVLAKHD